MVTENFGVLPKSYQKMITQKLESGFTHIAFNFMTKKEMPQGTE